jgi:hypothetical protein
MADARVGPGTSGLIRHAVLLLVEEVERTMKSRAFHAGADLTRAEKDELESGLVDEVKRLLLVEEGIDWQD